MKRINILGVPVDMVDGKGTLALIEKYIKEGNPHFLSFINPEIIMQCRKVPKLRSIIEKADLIAPDGIGIVWAAKMFGHGELTRVTGTEMMYEIAELSAAKGYSMYLLGAEPGIAEKSADILRKKFRGVNIVGVRHGYFKDDEEVVSDIERAKPDILVVCLGMVKQELWISKYFERLQIPVSFGNGGALDFVSGKVERAPQWMQRFGLEWLFRLMQDFSWRRIKRQFSLIEFAVLVIIQKMFHKP